MKKIIWVMLLLIMVGPVAHAQTVTKQTEKSLEMWQPHSITSRNGSLIVLSKERRVTDQIYRAMIGGICMGTIKRPASLSSVKEIKILNRFGAQGYVFEGGRKQCKKINDMPMSKTKIYILGRTHMHTN